jgi:hypothetical protein
MAVERLRNEREGDDWIDMRGVPFEETGSGAMAGEVRRRQVGALLRNAQSA